MTGISKVAHWETDSLKTRPARLGLSGDGTTLANPSSSLAMMHPARRVLLTAYPDKTKEYGILPMKLRT